MGLKEAAALTGISVSTLRRRRDSLRDHGAVQNTDGSWSIPIATLVDLGMLDKVTSGDGHHADADATPRHPPHDALDAQLADLRVEVERERGLRIAAERQAQATERQAEAITAHLATAQATIRMIEAAPPRVETRVERVEIEKPVEVEKRVEVPVPVTPRWVWPVVVAAVVLVLLAAALTGWNLTRNTDDAAPAPQPTTKSGQHSTPAADTWPTPPLPLDSRSPVPVDVAPPTP